MALKDVIRSLCVRPQAHAWALRVSAALMLGALGMQPLAGCINKDVAPVNPCTQAAFVRKVSNNSVSKVDLLFVIDKSSSMIEEQDAIKEQIPRLVRILASGDFDLDAAGVSADGVAEFPPPPDGINFAVISTDLGIGYDSAEFACSPTGDDAGFVFADVTKACRDLNGAGRDPALAAQPFVTYVPPADGSVDVAQISALSAEVGCRAELGKEGCGYERQLDAMLKALTPAGGIAKFPSGGAGPYDGVYFDTDGRGDGAPNQGFIRDDALLAVIVVSDENDCSAVDLNLFQPNGSGAPFGLGIEDQNLRCFQFNSQALHDPQRFVDGLLALKPDPELVVFSAITGIDRDLIPDPDFIDYDRILDPALTPSMVEAVDVNSDPNNKLLVPACDVPGLGKSFPGRRYVELAKALEEADSNGVIQSICQQDFSPALNAILGKIADVLGGACLSRELPADPSTGEVACEVLETLPAPDSGAPITRCADLATDGRDPDPVRIDDEGREVCRIQQRLADFSTTPPTAPTESGWYYDNFSADIQERCPATPQRVSFSGSGAPVTGAIVRIECLLAVEAEEDPAKIILGTPCTDDAFCASSTAIAGLRCDPQTNSCQRPCSRNVDCNELGGFVCDTRTDDSGQPRGICVEPRCSTSN